jgi:hypothetical protein
VLVAGGLNMLTLAATWTPPGGMTARASVSAAGQLEGVLVALRPAVTHYADEQRFAVHERWRHTHGSGL